MQFFHLFLISVQYLFVLSALGKQSAIQNNEALGWGNTVEGFQMAATVDATNGIIHCWIRNATTNTLNYPCSDFGDNGFVTFDIKSETNWISLIPWVFPSANEARPEPPYRTKTVKPGQVISYTEDLL